MKRRLIDGRYNVRRGLCRIRREEADIETPFGGLEGVRISAGDHIVFCARKTHAESECCRILKIIKILQHYSRDGIQIVLQNYAML